MGLQKLKCRSAVAGARALLIAPTRELALQTFTFAKAVLTCLDLYWTMKNWFGWVWQLAKFTGLRAAVLVGGDSLEGQFGLVHENPDLIIATPGRLLHVVVEMDLKLSKVELVVFDEADRLFEMGFAEQLREVLARLPESRQSLLFSATLPKQLVEFARAGLSQPVLIRLDVDSKLSDRLAMNFLLCRTEDKLPAFLYLLRNAVDLDREQALVFAATKHHVEWLGEVLAASAVPAAILYSSMDPVARNNSVARFRAKEVSVLVVTDIAARGVDIPLLDVALNFHFPAKPKLFVHRVGRVARAGRAGRAISLVAMDELPYLLDLFLFLGRPLRLVPQGGCPAGDEGADTLGAVAQAALDVEAESIAALLAASDVADARKVAENAMKQYNRSRPPASMESVKRVKNDQGLRWVVGTPESHPHPLFAALSGDTEVARTELLAGIKAYRSPLTIFESQTSSKHEQWRVMKAARKTHAAQIANRQTKAADRAQLAPALPHQFPPAHPSHQDSVSLDLSSAFSRVIAPKFHEGSDDRRKKKQAWKTGGGEARGVRSEHFIPFRQKDFHQEQGYAVAEKGQGGTFEEARGGVHHGYDDGRGQGDVQAGEEEEVGRASQALRRGERRGRGREAEETSHRVRRPHPRQLQVPALREVDASQQGRRTRRRRRRRPAQTLPDPTTSVVEAAEGRVLGGRAQSGEPGQHPPPSQAAIRRERARGDRRESCVPVARS